MCLRAAFPILGLRVACDFACAMAVLDAEEALAALLPRPVSEMGSDWGNQLQ